MLRLSGFFVIIAIATHFMGLVGISEVTISIANIFFVLFLLFALISLAFNRPIYF